ncbi:MAG: hypothetical protein DMG07_04425 [Acidobacteria bacterium]|nr:MAG: hypothetical protein DMG07_04425 [Acidobacteriota bacterium]
MAVRPSRMRCWCQYNHGKCCGRRRLRTHKFRVEEDPMTTSFRAFCCVVLFCLGLPAQEYRGSLSGTVTDPSGAAVPGVTIAVTSVERNVSYTTVSGEGGNYLVPFLQPGNYRVTAELMGFKRYTRSGVELRVGDKARLDIAMELGEVSETVTVSGHLQSVDTDTASRGLVVSNKEIFNLPTSGRNPFQLAWLSPGVIKQDTWRYLRPLDIAGSSGMSISGGRPQENEVLIDGVTGVRPGRQISLVPTIDATQEFKVQTNTYDAQYGRSGGGVVNISLKSGTNLYHGTAFFDEQASIFNANTFELNRGGARDSSGTAIRPSAKIHTFGYQMDGPVRLPGWSGRDKLFFMVSYEAIRQGTADPGVATFPIAEIRNGDFRALRNASGQPVLIYDPLTTRLDPSTSRYLRDPFPDNVIPTSRIDPVASRIVEAKYYPLPTSAGDTPAANNNYAYPSRWYQHFDSYIGRLDWAVRPRHNVYVRYGHNLRGRAVGQPAARARRHERRGRLDLDARPAHHRQCPDRRAQVAQPRRCDGGGLRPDPARLPRRSGITVHPAVALPGIQPGGLPDLRDQRHSEPEPRLHLLDAGEPDPHLARPYDQERLRDTGLPIVRCEPREHERLVQFHAPDDLARRQHRRRHVRELLRLVPPRLPVERVGGDQRAVRLAEPLLRPLRAGRLEGQRPPDAQPRPALGL